MQLKTEQQKSGVSLQNEICELVFFLSPWQYMMCISLSLPDWV